MASASEPADMDEITAQQLRVVNAAEELKNAIRALTPVDVQGRYEAIQNVIEAKNTALAAFENGRTRKAAFVIHEECMESIPCCEHFVSQIDEFDNEVLYEVFKDNEKVSMGADEIIDLCRRMGAPVPPHFAKYLKRGKHRPAADENSLKAEADR
jgi:hypothetical protein